ncbi:hypothetical protein BGZ99_002419, partial [Dissophora globulifera]
PAAKTRESSELSEATKRRREERFKRMNPSHFWTLSTGTRVEEVLFKVNVTPSATIKSRSYTIDYECAFTKSLFTAVEWQEIGAYCVFDLPQLPPGTLKYIVNAKDTMVTGKPVRSVPLPSEDEDTCELLLDTFRSWEWPYKKSPSPFLVEDLSEAFWGRNSWPLLMKLIDMNNIFMIDGEKAGLESSRRKNRGRQWEANKPLSRKKSGRKLDLITRDAVEKKDWLIVERMKSWDEQSVKFLRETSCDLFRETRTILTDRVQDAHNRTFRGAARLFGIYTGDRGFKTFEMKLAPGDSYVVLYKDYPTYELPSALGNMHQHVQGMTVMKATIAAYLEPQQEQEQEEEEDLSWMYGNQHNDLDAETTLASSPLQRRDETNICLQSDELVLDTAEQTWEDDDRELRIDLPPILKSTEDEELKSTWSMN